MSKSLPAFVAVATFLIGTQVAQAQTNVYSTDFGVAATGTTPGTPASDGFTYQQNELTTGETAQTIGGPTMGSGQNGWLTNDPDNNVTASNGGLVGGSNFVGSIADANGNSVFTGAGAYLGGLQRSTTAGQDVVPGATTTYLYHPLALPTTSTNLTFNVDIDLTASSGSFATQDSFAFTLRNTAGAQLLSINFATSGNVNGTTTPAQAGRLSAGYTVGNGVGTGTNNTNNSDNGIVLNTLYHLTVSVNVQANTFSAFFTSNGTTTIATNISLAGAPILPTAVTEVAAAWTLSNQNADAAGAYEGAGNDALLFDNYAVTVPEPSTYASIALGLVVLAWLGRMRRRA